jgi:hypothetical protein
MTRKLRVVLVLLAALTHVGAPMAAYAKATPAAMPGDFCSAARGVSPVPSDQGSPRPSSEHHCANAPCCAGGALDSTAPPSRVTLAVSVKQSPVRTPSSRPEALPPAPIEAAQPRGPPVLS